MEIILKQDVANLGYKDEIVNVKTGYLESAVKNLLKMDDVPAEVKAFLDYVDGNASEDSFVQEIEEEIRRVKQLEEERVGYMTYAMKIEEERELAEEKGRLDKTVSVVTNMLKKHYPYAEISEMAETTEEEVIRIAKEAGLAYV